MPVAAAERSERRLSWFRVATLVVDDDAADRRAVRRRREASAISDSVVEAVDAKSALDLVDSERVDCILLDFHLPDVSAPQFVVRLFQLQGLQAPAVIVLTGDASQRGGIESMKHGAVEFVGKSELSEVDLPGLTQKRIEVHQMASRSNSESWNAFTRLVGSTAHNVNNPATIARLSVDAAVELIERAERGEGPSAVGPQLRQLLEAIDDSIKRIASVVQDLTGSRIRPESVKLAVNSSLSVLPRFVRG